MSSFRSKKIMFVGGKGGVGKSTSAAALALAIAQQQRTCLIVSTDPAHNLGDIFHHTMKQGKVKLAESLWGVEIDPAEESKRYIDSVKDNMKGMVKSHMVEEVHRQIDMASASPGAEEAAMFDKIVSIVLEESDDFDHIIFDTAPTGHTIRLLSLPELMGVWMDGMLERRKKTNENYTQLLNDGEPVEDPIYDVLMERKKKFQSVRDILLDQSQTGFIFVLNPERLAILETKKAVDQLKQHDIHAHTLIVNKVLPEHADGRFLAQRREQEADYLHEIDQTFPDKMLIRIPLYEEDINTIEKLSIISDRIQDSIRKET
ncbi:ArsA family ATPase [Thalassobacillus sp. CUG 92003]|uniref:ArsA family ATPase n=1 Tax=Thalassobacillus sp. CUG 92003 TaxID=2736641 RepID=UPI0015E7D0B6|nr:ArsA family ATPase [Thalassobacillus sp. CUG 92003]